VDANFLRFFTGANRGLARPSFFVGPLSVQFVWVDNQLIHETFVLKIVTLKPGKVLNLALQNVRGYTNSGIALNRFFRHEEGEQLYG